MPLRRPLALPPILIGTPPRSPGKMPERDFDASSIISRENGDPVFDEVPELPRGVPLRCRERWRIESAVDLVFLRRSVLPEPADGLRVPAEGRPARDEPPVVFLPLVFVGLPDRDDPAG